jgi:hypothetical protein
MRCLKVKSVKLNPDPITTLIIAVQTAMMVPINAAPAPELKNPTALEAVTPDLLATMINASIRQLIDVQLYEQEREAEQRDQDFINEQKAVANQLGFQAAFGCSGGVAVGDGAAGGAGVVFQVSSRFFQVSPSRR